MGPLELVCLCDEYDLKGMFGAAFEEHPWIRLVTPEDVSTPGDIRHALVFSPGPEAFRPYPALRLVSCAGAGVDALLRHPGLAPEIAISRIKLAEQAEMIAAFAMWHIIGWQRRLASYPAQQKRKEWNPINRTAPSSFPVGILGYGHMGATLARRLHDLNYPVTAYASNARDDAGVTVLSGPGGLSRIANNCLAIVNLLPLTPGTEGILSAAFFAMMRKDAIIINLGRGGHLVEADLVSALEHGHIAAAALDTFATEPLPREHPFWDHDRVFITPHVAGDADPSAVAQFVADGIVRFENGKRPEGMVDRNRGY